MIDDGSYCCKGECCGPGSWCCARAGEHEHDPDDEPHSPRCMCQDCYPLGWMDDNDLPGMWERADFIDTREER